MGDQSNTKANKSADFARRTRTLRARRNISQTELAHLMSFGRSTVVGVERGNPPSERFVAQLEMLEQVDGISDGAPITQNAQAPTKLIDSQVTSVPDTSYGSDPRGVLKRKRIEKGWTPQEFARRMRFKAAYITDIEEAHVRPTEKYLRKAASVLDLPLDALMAGSDQPPLMGAGVTFGATPRIKNFTGLDDRTIPLISFSQAGEMKSYDDIYDYEGVVDYAKKGPKTFAVRIRGDSMTPRYPEGTIAIVEPERQLRTEKRVIAKLKDGSVLFKQLQMQGDTYRLISLNPIYEPIVVSLSGIEWIYMVVRTLQDEDL